MELMVARMALQMMGYQAELAQGVRATSIGGIKVDAVVTDAPPKVGFPRLTIATIGNVQTFPAPNRPRQPDRTALRRIHRVTVPGHPGDDAPDKSGPVPPCHRLPRLPRSHISVWQRPVAPVRPAAEGLRRHTAPPGIDAPLRAPENVDHGGCRHAQRLTPGTGPGDIEALGFTPHFVLDRTGKL